MVINIEKEAPPLAKNIKFLTYTANLHHSKA